jgi:hypothetical protein
MGTKPKTRKRVSVQKDNYASKEAFLLCETPGCRNAVAAWAIPTGYSKPVLCSGCLRTESR